MQTKPTHNRVNFSSGFTLIELLVTLFIMAVLSAIVIPIAGQFIANMEARSFVLELEADIALAQKHAIATEHPVRFTVKRLPGVYMMRELTEGSLRTIKTVYVPESVSISDLDITFQPNVTFAGQSNGGTVYIKRDNERYANVIISLLSSRTRVEWQ